MPESVTVLPGGLVGILLGTLVLWLVGEAWLRWQKRCLHREHEAAKQRLLEEHNDNMARLRTEHNARPRSLRAAFPADDNDIPTCLRGVD